MGFDLKKHPKVILDAYNDQAGITSMFNLNLLNRINRELDADFYLDQFEHYQTYDPGNGASKSYLVSLQEQTVTIGHNQLAFARDETIFMEISQKYTLAQIEELARASGFAPVYCVSDS
ncbi:MAG: egtD [Adhaeribacter sp.]|nr:egtD [Adhaeribacter sp.]